jgi:hypothetical protein
VPCICPSHPPIIFVFKTTALEGSENTLLCQPHLRKYFTNSMELSPSWEVPSRSVPEEFLNTLRNSKFHYHVDLSLSWARLIQSVPRQPISLGLIIILSSHLCVSFPSVLLPSGFHTKTLCVRLLSPCMLYTLPISYWLHHSNYVLRRGQIINLFIFLYSRNCYNFISLRSPLFKNSKRCTINLILANICIYLNRKLSIFSKTGVSK